MTTRATITAVIITFNEEDNIRRCIDSLKSVSDEIIVVDSLSTDKTVQLAEAMGARVVSKAWTGYSDAKNHGNSLAACDFILSIDADESLSPELADQIQKVKSNPEFDIYRMNRLTNFCGQWIYHSGWYPDWCIRLFRKGKVSWEGLVHETLTGVDGSFVGELKGHLFHYSYPTIKSFLNKVSQYASLAAEKDFRRGKRYTLLWHGLLKPASKFFTKYFIQLGFLDGREGFIIACISAFERFLRYTSFGELRKKNES